MPRGRPRSAAVDDALSRAVARLLAERGYAAMTIEEVAARAGVAKTAIYRRWSSKAEMVFTLVIHTERITAPPDQGSLAADLRALTQIVVDDLSSPAARQAGPGLLADMCGRSPFADRMRSVFLKAQLDQVGAVLERALARGELAAAPSAASVRAQLLGTVFAWVFLSAAEPPADVADRVSGAVLAAIRAGCYP